MTASLAVGLYSNDIWSTIMEHSLQSCESHSGVNNPAIAKRMANNNYYKPDVLYQLEQTMYPGL